jgi:hypothetical protein
MHQSQDRPARGLPLRCLQASHVQEGGLSLRLGNSFIIDKWKTCEEKDPLRASHLQILDRISTHIDTVSSWLFRIDIDGGQDIRTFGVRH